MGAQGLRDYGNGPEKIASSEDRKAVAGQARTVNLLALATALMTVSLMFLAARM